MLTDPHCQDIPQFCCCSKLL